eukprot:scaffold4811_cov171-Cylindrotheca_fusiformis.AAC.9
MERRQNSRSRPGAVRIIVACRGFQGVRRCSDSHASGFPSAPHQSSRHTENRVQQICRPQSTLSLSQRSSTSRTTIVSTMEDYEQLATTLCQLFLLVILLLDDEEDDHCQQEEVPRRSLVQRSRPSNDAWLNEINTTLFKRLYRMDKESFLDLLKKISPLIQRKNVSSKRKRGGSAPNGMISNSQRLGMALRYFAGGDPHDIAESFNVGESEPTRSVWFITDAIHQCPDLSIKFPSTYSEQQAVAAGFKEISSIDIPTCVGAIDGILIWTHKANKNHIKNEEWGQEMTMFCDRKKKYGLNMQGTCDALGRFLDVEIKFPGSTSDYYAFQHTGLKKKVEQEGFLYPGLALFGDNAYKNSPYMVTPCQNAGEGFPCDDFNFFQSQVRISIESAFGMLVHRWGILRKPIPMNVSIPKTTSLVLALCKLHNHCINCNDIPIERPIQLDLRNIITSGGLFLPRMNRHSTTQEEQPSWSYDMSERSEDRLMALLDGGDHCDDHNPQMDSRAFGDHKHDLPYQVLYERVQDEGLCRPACSTYRPED